MEPVKGKVVFEHVDPNDLPALLCTIETKTCQDLGIRAYSAGFAPEVLSRLLSLEKLLRPVDLVQQVRAIVLSRRPHDLGDFDGPGIVGR